MHQISVFLQLCKLYNNGENMAIFFILENMNSSKMLNTACSILLTKDSTESLVQYLSS